MIDGKRNDVLDVSESVTCSSCSNNFGIYARKNSHFHLKHPNNIQIDVENFQNFRKFLEFREILTHVSLDFGQFDRREMFDLIFLINHRKFHRISGSILDIFALLNAFEHHFEHLYLNLFLKGKDLLCGIKFVI